MIDVKTKLQPCQWTNGGKHVLIVRCINPDGTSRGGFKNPTTVGAQVEALDWNPTPECGGGIHGWPWGFFLGQGKACEWQRGLWQVYAVLPEQIIDLGGKCKFRSGTLLYSGNWLGVWPHIFAGRTAFVRQNANGSAATSGYESSAATSGDRSSAATSGDGSSAAADGAASAAVCVGIESRAKAGEYGCIALQWHNERARRWEMRCAQTGPGPGCLKPHVWYRLNSDGQFVEDKEA